MDDDSEDGINIEENYYSFLNVPKNATTEEINTSYRTLSRIYHPDKHINVDNKQKAELLFNRTKKAYEVLSDPHKRAIYDSLGIQGLQTEGWEIVHRTRTPAEIRQEYERLAQEREERKLQQRTNPKGNITINVNATDIFNKYTGYEEHGFPTIEVSSMSISQSIEAPLTLRDTAIMSGSLQSSNGNGNGGFMISGRRLINKGWLELDVGAGNGPIIGVKGSRNLTPKVFFNGGGTMNFRQNGVIPGLVGTLAVQLDKHTVGYLTYNFGQSMTTIIEHTDESNLWSASAVIGMPHCYIAASYTKKLLEKEMKLKVAGRVGTFGFIAEYGAEKKISKYSSIFASVSIGVPTGVTLKIKIIRSQQSYTFPIHLSEEIVPAAIFYATVTPLIAWFLLKNAIIEPMNAEQKRRDIEKVKEANQQRIAEKKKEAECAIDLMKAMWERIKLEEETKHGLLILNAIYEMEPNDINSVTNNDSEYNRRHFEDCVISIDVTIPVQCLVKDSKLTLYNTSKCELPGFYDPCLGENKQLKIEYSYRDIVQTIIVKDLEPVHLPILPNTNTNNNEKIINTRATSNLQSNNDEFHNSNIHQSATAQKH